MLQLADLGYRYRPDAAWALQGVSLTLPRGEIFGLLGPNGAGKSTLMALVAGLRRPQTGTIRRAPEIAVRGGFALVPQDFAFYPMLTCRENLAFFAGVLGLGGATARRRIAAAIGATELEAVAGKRTAECSGGLKRRLNLAIGLVGDPQLLLLDEPTAGVDPQSRAFLLDTVRALRAQGKTIIYTSHYMEEVQAISDRVGIIDHGRLLCCGTLAELLTEAPTSLTVRVAPAPTPAARAALTVACGLEPGGQDGGHLRFPMPADRPIEEVLAVVRQHGLAITGVEYGCRHLEDLFLKLTDRSLRD
jgi:ABC-2 type transport system ATP-binding protein